MYDLVLMAFSTLNEVKPRMLCFSQSTLCPGTEKNGEQLKHFLTTTNHIK